MTDQPDENLRIASLLPSATDIGVALGLAPYIVGVTHECDMQAVHQGRTRDETQNRKGEEGMPFVLTENGLGQVDSQGEIHKAVVREKEKQENQLTCSPDDINSLYPILPSAWKKAQPTIVLTQDLCSVCAPSPNDVQRVIQHQNDNKDNDIVVVSLQPTTLTEVADSFVTVACACGVGERGEKLRKRFLDNLLQLKTTIQSCLLENKSIPRLFLLEWLDPPFDGGHWIIQMMEYACVCPARASNDTKTNIKSQQVSWETVTSSQPDLVLVACCGFDLDRNVRDVMEHRHHFLSLGDRVSENVFASDGHKYFACPGPNLVTGTAILAQCAYRDNPTVLDAIQSLPFIPQESQTGWQHVNFRKSSGNETAIPDMEDLVAGNNNHEEDFTELHQVACEAGEMSYKDPATGYSVFTELAHKKRGKCCGSGCRHCPFNHENVVDKVNRIKQPAFLYENKSTGLFALHGHTSVKVLFFSGGKDSFLTIRALTRSCKKSNSQFGLVLLTTFDSQSRIIAHQETHIDTVVRQAKHLDISLLGVPMHRGTKEPYTARIRRGLDVIEASLGETRKLSSLVFGDLHLHHIRQWRDRQLSSLNYELEYPLWQVPYSELMQDLEASRVPCRLSASTNDQLEVGDLFNREYSEQKLKSSGLNVDIFGENGEFHTVAEVWNTTREVALGTQT